VAIAAALYREIPIFEYSPKKVKQSITGNGSASKEQVAAMVMNLLEIKDKPKYLDATDALGIAVCHYFQNTGERQNLQDTKYSGWKAFIEQNPKRLSGK
jgi:crossover junction endodeoxyribonuclease RuvC